MAKVTLGTLSFEAHKFTVGEYEDVADAQERLTKATTNRERLVGLREIVLVAARREHSSLTAEDLRALEASPDDLRAAVTAIFEVNGLLTPRGEGKAEDRAA